MFVSAIRTVLIYSLVMVSIRIMGKRQISELRPSELVVALLISDLAAVPMENPGNPLLYGVMPIFLLVALELILSGIMLKFPRFEQLISGNPVPIIRDGVLDVNALKKLRLSIDDLLEAMRMQNLFRFADISYALVETNGHISFYPRAAAMPVTCGDVQAAGKDTGMPALVISDGAFCDWGLQLCGKSRAAVCRFLERKKLKPKEVFLLTVSAAGDYFLLTAGGKTDSGEAKI